MTKSYILKIGVKLSSVNSFFCVDFLNSVVGNVVVG